MKTLLKIILLAVCAWLPAVAVNSHPHVFVDATIDIIRDEQGNFTQLRQVWVFDEIFSTTLVYDFDEDGDGKLGKEEIKIINDTVKASIADYDFYTAIRVNGKPYSFYEPSEFFTYYDDENRLVMVVTIEPEKPYDFSSGPLRFSASDTSFYVAFAFESDSVKVEGGKGTCKTSVEHPDFDKLYAENSLSLTEAFFEDPSNTASFGDEFYSWAEITCQ